MGRKETSKSIKPHGKQRTADSVFIKLELNVKHSTISHYFALSIEIEFFKCHNFINFNVSGQTIKTL